ncbi:MAG TPA: hypothetical protein VMS17_28800 [Gemmataceae bacterium]|nr:hypothetical protein [Gemmataceae bacterium]
MRTRLLPLAGLLLLAAPVLTRAADDRPAIVVAFKSLDGLTADAKYIAELAGKDNEAAQFEALVKRFLGKNLSAVDSKKPIGLYVRINADDPQLSEAVVLVPVADEDGLIGLLKNFPSLTVDNKDADGVYKVMAENVPVPIYFRFANKYAYVTAANKDAIAKNRLLAPTAVLPPQGTSLLMLAIHGDAIPAKYKDMAVTAVTQQLAQAKQQDQPGETPTIKAFRLAAIDQAGELIQSVIEDGSDLTVSVDVDQAAGELSASAVFSGKPGSKLAGGIADLATKKSLGASLIGSDSAVNMVINLAVPQKVRESASDLLVDGLKQALANAPGGRDLADTFIKAATPTIKAGVLDAGLDLRGPTADGHYTLVMGMKVEQGAEVEKLLRDIVKAAPADQKNLKLDVAKVGSVSIHQIIPDANQSMDENTKKLFGENPNIYFAVRDDAILLAGGPGALDALKSVASAKPTPGPTIQVEVSMSRAAKVAAGENPAAPDIAKKVFKDGKKDKVRLSIQGGKALTLKFSMDAPVITFSAQLQEAQGAK